MIESNAQNKKNLRNAYWVFFLVAFGVILSITKFVVFPNGIEAIPSDTLRKVSEQVGMDCASTITKLAWTPTIEAGIIKKFKAIDKLKGGSEEKKTSYANCLLAKLKEKYPKGLVEAISQKEMDKIYKECLYVLK